MGEVRQLAVVIITAIIIGIVGFWLGGFVSTLIQGDLVVSDYHSSWSYDGSLNESYQYVVKSDQTYRSLNRIFNVPVSYGISVAAPVSLISVTVPRGAYSYLKDYAGVVHMEGAGKTDQTLIQNHAQSNEAGAFDPGYYSAGTWPVAYSWVISPPIERGSDADHLNIDLATDHVAYQSVTITIPADRVKEVFPHPAGLKVTKSGDSFVITGSALSDIPLGFELVLDRGAGDQIRGKVSDLGSVKVLEKTNAANPWYSAILTTTPYIAYAVSLILLILIPVLLLLIWYLKGREKPFIVPEHLSVVPDPSLKPWMVNLIFEGDPEEFGNEGLYATLLDMHRQKLIRIDQKPDSSDLTITILKDQSTDAYEQTVLNTFRRIATDNVIDTGSLASMADAANSDSSVRTALLAYQEELKSLTSYSSSYLESHYIEDGRGYLVPLLIIPIIWLLFSIFTAIAGSNAPLGFTATILSGAAFLQGLVGMLFPATLFGRWKGDTYEEKLRWDSFRSFLSDAVLIKRYAPSDISMWGEWLVYGTALGVGDRVVSSMKDLNVNLPEFSSASGTSLFAPALFASAFMPVTSYAPPSSGSGS
ncbi:MAG TPA: DUF2207 domain-containing protein, partial [Methanospirillum sp.]|uniref:DUF2207 domain-containing protein n=1 Tax=Methanospirillum sp. TaxID=45200 RepID=UPI002BEE443E